MSHDRATHNDPIVCDMSAIPADQRQSHIALAKSLLASSVVFESDAEMRFELAPDRLADVIRFVDNERRCCRHLAFFVEVPARDANLLLRVSGPGVREELHALR